MAYTLFSYVTHLVKKIIASREARIAKNREILRRAEALEQKLHTF